MSNSIWGIDPTHSELGFKVRHLMTNVSGNFTKFEGTVENASDDFSTAKVNFTADIDSVFTNNEQRDGHLKSADFFDAAAHPHLKFESTNIEKVGEKDYAMHGNLEIKGVKNPVTLAVENLGHMTDPYGNLKAGYALTGKFNRKDFGLSWNAPLEAGGILLGDEIKVNADIQLAKQA